MVGAGIFLLQPQEGKEMQSGKLGRPIPMEQHDVEEYLRSPAVCAYLSSASNGH